MQTIGIPDTKQLKKERRFFKYLQLSKQEKKQGSHINF